MLPGVLASNGGLLQSLIGSWGYLIVFLITGLESCCIPFLPGETVLVTAAVLASTQHSLAIPGVIAAAAAGPIVGGGLAFWLGWWGGYRLLVRHGHRVRLGQTQVKMARYLFRRHGGKIVSLGRFVVVLRSFAGLAAGASRMAIPRFLVYNAAGSAVWAATYGLATYFAANAFQRLTGTLAVAFGVVAAVALVIAVMVVRRQEARLRDRAEREFPGPLEGYPGSVPR